MTFIQEVGFPVIAKPDNGVGATHTYKLDNEQELADYLEDRSWDDAEERYITQHWIYDSCLFLQAVVIPGDTPGIPAKVIACKDPERISGEMVIFGPEELLNDFNPMSMDQDAFRAWMEYRNTFGLRPRNIGRDGHETVL